MRTAKSPYKLRPENLLPKFGTSGEAKPRETSQMVLPISAEAGSERPGEIPTTVVAAAAPAGEQAVATGGARRAAEPAPEKKPSGFTRFFRRNPFAAKDASNGGARLTQAEMAFSKIRVVRNDLTDSDIEVVPRLTAPRPAMARPTVAKPSPPLAPPPVANLRMEGKVVDLTERLLETGRSRS